MRQVWTRIRHLPDDSALARRQVAGEEVFSLTQKLQASAINELRIGNYYFVSANSEKKNELAEPDIIDFE